MAGAAIGPIDEVFLEALYRGSELIGRGEYAEARALLEDVLGPAGQDPKARNLLGLACFKLGDLGAAQELYQSLVDENPEDAALRVNLGLVLLKRGAFEHAIEEFEHALRLRPDHLRAQNYLAVAYARVGDYAQAQFFFAAAGSDEMAARMDRLLAGDSEVGEESALEERQFVQQDAVSGDAGAEQAEPFGIESDASEAGEQAASSDLELGGEEAGGAIFHEVEPLDGEEEPAGPLDSPEREIEEAGGEFDGMDPRDDEASLPDVEIDLAAEEQDDSGARLTAAADDVAAEQLTAALLGADSVGSDESDSTGEGEPDHDVDEFEIEVDAEAAACSSDSGDEPGRGMTSGDRLLGAPPQWTLVPQLGEPIVEAVEPNAAQGPFDASECLLAVAVAGDVLVRTAGLLSVDGTVELRPEMKRFRGRTTDKPFGEGESRIARFSGHGSVQLGKQGRRFTPLRVAGVDAYLREELVFGFEAALDYENGRVPSSHSRDLPLVHLTGEGFAIVATGGLVLTSPIPRDGMIRVELERLVGWKGPAVPRIVLLAQDGGPKGGPLLAVELTGEGLVYACLPER